MIDDVPVLLPETLSRQQTSQSRYFDAEFESFPSTYRPENWRVSSRPPHLSLAGYRGGAKAAYLDVGVGGAGATVIEAARLGVEATGCDLSGARGPEREQAGPIGERRRANAHFVACAAESLPFPDDSFACASAVAVLEHVEDDPKAAAELARVVCQPAGSGSPSPLAYRYILPPLWPVYAWHDRKLGHKRHYDEARTRRPPPRAGLEHAETTYTGHAVKVLQLALDRLLPSSTPRGNRLWWRLERLDLRASHRPYGALQLNVVFRKPEEVTTA